MSTEPQAHPRGRRGSTAEVARVGRRLVLLGLANGVPAVLITGAAGLVVGDGSTEARVLLAVGLVWTALALVTIRRGLGYRRGDLPSASTPGIAGWQAALGWIAAVLLVLIALFFLLGGIVMLRAREWPLGALFTAAGLAFGWYTVEDVRQLRAIPRRR